MGDREYLNILAWESVHADVGTLAGQIEASGYKPDLILGIGQGGIIPSTLLYFALPEARFRIVYPKASDPGAVEPPSDVAGRRVLLADDLAITGDSLLEVKNTIAALGPAEIRTACLYASTGYAGLDYLVRNLDPMERIVFPWYCGVDVDGVRVYKYKERFGKHEPVR